MAQYGENVQRRWKVSTCKTLEQLDAAEDASGAFGDIIEQEIVTPLYELLNGAQTDKFKTDLKGVFASALELSRRSESDQSPVCFGPAPSMSEQGGWMEYSPEKYEASDTDDLVLDASIVHIRHEPLYVRPKIFRSPGRATSAFPSLTIKTGREEADMIQAGIVLFPDTGIFQEGASQWQKIWYAGVEVAKEDRRAGARA